VGEGQYKQRQGGSPKEVVDREAEEGKRFRRRREEMGER
jgi:hypothetical protein